ncbi:chorismate synthase [Tuber brumale]|nr:chorismate synthase [Tuber brumale]
MAKLIAEYRGKSNSIGGTFTCQITNVPIGLCEPCFDKLESKLAHALLSIGETKGGEVALGFKGPGMPGSLHNDPVAFPPPVRRKGWEPQPITRVASRVVLSTEIVFTLGLLLSRSLLLVSTSLPASGKEPLVCWQLKEDMSLVRFPERSRLLGYGSTMGAVLIQ